MGQDFSVRIGGGSFLRETFFLNGKKRRLPDLDEIRKLVRAAYPGAIAQGSTCHWSWILDKKIVAESWMSNNMKWWYYVIATDGGLATEG